MAKWMWIVAGPPGAGKTSLTAQLFPTWLSTTRHIDADDLRGIDEDDYIDGDLRSSVPVSKRLQIAEFSERDFVVETRLINKKVLSAATRLRARKWRIVLIYLALPQLELCRRRVRARVAKGGADVSDAVMERGFHAALKNLSRYIDLSDRWLILDSTGVRAARIAQGRKYVCTPRQADVLRALLPDYRFIPGGQHAPWADTVEAEFLKIARWHGALDRLMSVAERMESRR